MKANDFVSIYKILKDPFHTNEDDEDLLVSVNYRLTFFKSHIAQF